MAASASNTFNNAGLTPLYDANEAKQLPRKFSPSLTVAKGTVVGQISATGLWDVYDDGDATGLEVARGIAAYDFTTDGDGNHIIGGGEQGEKQQTAPVFFCGTFRTTELTGLDAAAVADLGKLISGSVADGVLVVTGPG